MQMWECENELSIIILNYYEAGAIAIIKLFLRRTLVRFVHASTLFLLTRMVLIEPIACKRLPINRCERI
jgi:hypothetical protein